MKLHIEIRPDADRDIIDLADFIAVDNRQAAARFLEQLEATFARLASNPRLGRPAGFPDKELRDLRICLVNRFRRHLILYRVHARSIEVVRVMHGARDLNSLLGPEK